MSAELSSPDEAGRGGSVGMRPMPSPPPVHDWRRRIARVLTLSDLGILLIVVFGTQVIWFGFGNTAVVTRESVLTDTSYWLFSTGLVALWMWTLSLAETRSASTIGAGNVEYMRVIGSSFRLFGAIAIFAFLLRVDIARGYLLIALPAGLVMLGVSRWLWRHWLLRRRLTGNYSARTILVGSRFSVTEVVRELDRHPTTGYLVVGACLVDTTRTDPLLGRIPVLGGLDDVQRSLDRMAADTVVITSTDGLSQQKVKQISWDLEAGRQHLVLAPSIVDVAGPRLRARPVAGVPLIHVETPHFTLGQRVVKRTLDVLLGSVLLALLSPLMIALAIAIRSTSHGPALFVQTRVGYHAREFRILKFRSMVDGAEDQLDALVPDAGNTVLFKLTNDPRITPIGRFLRRHSLDELPQLFNVIAGTMSLVGPRPPLPSEVDKYDDHVHRRFLVKPGMTGAWQVGGRSRLNWEDSVRLDLSYVENWSLAGDLVILLRTFRTVVKPGDTTA